MKTLYINEKRKLTSRRIKKIAKKTYKKARKEECTVILSKAIEKNEELIDALLEYNLTILDGRWLLKLLLLDILEYLANSENQDIETLNVAILTDSLDEIILSQIIQIANLVKTLKIVTSKTSRFLSIEKRLYEELGIAIQITNNKEKAIITSDLIFNIDFSKSKLKDYKISNNAIIVNILYEINDNFENFKGTIINNYDISYNEEIFGELKEKSDFDFNCLYESYIYRKDRYANLKMQLINDGVRIIRLY